eukprot:TRINITY_DN1641_c0_g1_i2.p1 TRINITY_DN1641_c0_g1~~TRINITY_DN1641_c0_g1_i2.p1  ORF type:complete len:261 (-),score=35.10 TRINITY_DN1641_c0_g1_i2:49-831(-)
MLRFAASRAQAVPLVRWPTAPSCSSWAKPRRCDQPVRRRYFNASRPGRAAEAKEGDGISVEVTYSGLWGAITTFPKRKPYATNIIIATVKTSAADLVIQTAEGKDSIDWKRNAVFTTFGFIYLGALQWFIYVTAFSRLCPNAIKFANMPWAEKLKFRAGQIDLLKQTALDNFVHYTFIYFPVFYMFKESIQGESNKSFVDTVGSALNKYKSNFMQDNMAMWALWVPFDLIIYAVPIWMRLPLNHGVSFVWTCILSWMRGN